MKKYLRFVMIAAGVLCGLLAVTACKRLNGAEHTHVSDNYEIITDATCTQNGERSGVCTVCGKEFTETIVATGHDWHLQSEEDPTCTLNGNRIYACANCFETDEQSVPALGHDDGVVIDAVPATCEMGGWTEGRKCSRCNEAIVLPQAIPATGHDYYYKNYTDDAHLVFCRNCNYSEIADCEFEEIDVAPTCTEAGKLLHTCKLCGDSHEHETSAAVGHLWTENWIFYVVTEEGYKHRKTCYRCDAYQEEACDNRAGQAVQPTCELTGYTQYACDSCKNTFQSDFQQELGHEWTEYVLDDDNIDPYSHTHKRQCQRLECGIEQKGVPVGVAGNVILVRTDRTCETDAFSTYSCSLATCEYSRIETDENTALGHSWSEWQYNGDYDEHHTHTHHCLRGGCTEEETTDCRMISSSQAATCTKPQVDVDVCQDCFYVDRDESPALGHQWGKWINVRNSDGTYLHSHACNVCNTREYGSHSYAVTTKPADCEHDAETVQTCSVCAFSIGTAQPNTALGHDWKLESHDALTHALVCLRNPEHTVNELHDFNTTNLCPYDGVDGLTYELSSSGEYYIVSNDNGLGKATEIIVPSFHGDTLTKPVGAIGKYAFSANNTINKITLPATITLIDDYAFSGCSALTTVAFSGGVSQLTSIGYGAFMNCKNLTDITLFDNLVSIGTLAFSGCTSLTVIDIPDSVNEIGLSAFNNTGLYNNRENWLNGALYVGLHLIKADSAYFTESNTDFIIKEGTIGIGEYAFENCTGMKKVTIPLSVTKIGSDAFKGCVNLNEVEYRGSVADWFNIAFANSFSSPMYYATQMSITGEESTEVTLPDHITNIPAGTFKGNTKIVKVTIPESVTTIGEEAFKDCTALAEIIFANDRVTAIGKDAFLNTAFYNDESKWQDGVLYLNGCHLLAANDRFDSDTLIIDDNVRTISAGAFANCRIKNVTIGSGVIYIGAEAFATDSLVSVTFTTPGSVWLAKNVSGIVRKVTANENPASNATLLKDYRGEWKKL